MDEVWHVILLALTVIMEARNQPAAGQEGVAWVVMNRAHRSGWTVEEVLYQQNQFAVWNDLEKRMRVLVCYSAGELPGNLECLEPRVMAGTEEYFWGIFWMAWEVYHGERDPPAGLENVCSFDNPRFWPEGLPAWLSGDCVEVGDHVFCECS